MSAASGASLLPFPLYPLLRLLPELGAGGVPRDEAGWVSPSLASRHPRRPHQRRLPQDRSRNSAGRRCGTAGSGPASPGASGNRSSQAVAGLRADSQAAPGTGAARAAAGSRYSRTFPATRHALPRRQDPADAHAPHHRGRARQGELARDGIHRSGEAATGRPGGRPAGTSRPPRPGAGPHRRNARRRTRRAGRREASLPSTPLRAAFPERGCTRSAGRTRPAAAEAPPRPSRGTPNGPPARAAVSPPSTHPRQRTARAHRPAARAVHRATVRAREASGRRAMSSASPADRAAADWRAEATHRQASRGSR